MIRTGWQILVATSFSIQLTDQKTPDKPFDEKNLVFVLQKPKNEDQQQSTK